MSEVREVSLGEGFGEVAVKANGARVEIHADGSIDAYTDADVQGHPAVQAELKPGDRMKDGTIYAGISPDTHKPMYTKPKDAPLTLKWKAAMHEAAMLDAHGHQDWRVPTKAELNVLFNNRAVIGGFDKVSGSGLAGWYWSSTEFSNSYAWAQRFSDGGQDWNPKSNVSSLRCVRG